MNLLTQTLDALISVGLVRSAQAFSTEYLQRNPNCYAYQKHRARDISFGAAVACLQSARAELSTASLTPAQQTALHQLEQDLLNYLAEQHAVVDVCTNS